ncbi:MAG: sulfite exporter TauE/SafE family protein [Actinomycetota bacterium]
MSGEEIAVALLAILLGSAIKSISGMGLPLVGIPIISFVTDLETAVAAIAIPNLLINVAMAWRARDMAAETRDLPVLGVMGVIGGVVGTYALVSFSEEPLVAVLVAVVTIYVITFIRTPDFRIGPATSRRAAPAVGLGTGLLQGAIGISGPLIGSWIHSYRLDRRTHIFSVTILFALAGAAQLGALLVAGELDGRWTVALLGCIPALATIPLGERLRSRFSSEGFDRFIVATITVTVTALAVRTFL